MEHMTQAQHRIERVESAADPRLDDFRSLTDSALRRRVEAASGLYLAESFPVLERAIAAGHRPRAVLTQEKWLERVLSMLPDGTAVFVVSAETAEALTGFAVHRGVLATVERPSIPSVAEVLSEARTVVVLEDVSDTTNVGAIFRTAAALGADAVLVTPEAADPLYRRSVRVSMGTVFQVPWTRTGPWRELSAQLRDAGFSIAALALSDDAVDLADYRRPERVAVVFGAEGSGLTPTALAEADTVLTIPMGGAVDSLNVATAAAITLWALREHA